MPGGRQVQHRGRPHASRHPFPSCSIRRAHYSLIRVLTGEILNPRVHIITLGREVRQVIVAPCAKNQPRRSRLGLRQWLPGATRTLTGAQLHRRTREPIRLARSNQSD